MSFKTSVIIPTYNRPEELKNCISSVLIQTRMPYELIIVDDGNLPEFPLRHDLEAKGIKCIYLKKETPGLTASRNAGIKSATGDIIFFLDDDVVLDADYFQEILSIYENDADKLIGGVGGIQKNFLELKLKDYLLWLPETLFLLNGFKEGRVLPSGFCIDYGTTPFPVKKTADVDFLAGCSMSFRREVFGEISFDTEKYLGYGLGEDKDFSFRVSRRRRLIVNANAKLLHLESQKMRLDKMLMAEQYVISNYVFFKKYLYSSLWNLILFSYALTGYAAIRSLMFLISPKKENLARLKGIYRGAKYICSAEKVKV